MTVVLVSLVACRSAHPAGSTNIMTSAPDQRAVAADTLGRSVVAFMQGMIGHHAQALQMAGLAPTRASRPEVRLLAERIHVSQTDEIAQMERWLRSRGHTVPASDAHAQAAMGHAALMPGMLTPAQLDSLTAASGSRFDRLFLQGMIQHHQGALTMVAGLLANRRNLDAETFRLVSDIDADQRAEIQRMQALLKTIP